MSEKDISLTVADAFESVIDDKIDGHIRQDNTSHLAEVVRIDPDGTHWVHVYGGADLTPVTNLASTAQVGDIINVTISNNSILGTGNISSPAPTKTYVDKQNAGVIQIVGNAIGADLSGLSYKDGVLRSEKIVTDKLQARVGEFQQAIAEKLEAKTAAIEYAKIDAANITAAQVKTAWIDKLLVDTDLLAKEGTIFKLEAIEVDADKITAGTIDVNRLIYSETDSQGVTHSHLVTFQENPQTGQVEMVYEDDPNLQGSIIEDRTLTADKIVAGSITTNEITAQNLQGINGWINLTQGTFGYGATPGDGIWWDGTDLHIHANEITSIVGDVDNLEAMVHQYGQGVLVCRPGQTVGALVNANGSFDAVSVTWNNGVPTTGDTLATFGSTSRVGNSQIGSYLDLVPRGMNLSVDIYDDRDDSTVNVDLFEIFDKRDNNTASYEFIQYITCDGSTHTFNLPYVCDAVTSVTISRNPPSDFVTLSYSFDPPTDYGVCWLENVVYKTTSGTWTEFGSGVVLAVHSVITDPRKSTYFLFGSTTKELGGTSFSAGINVGATGFGSVSFGVGTVASGYASHAEGNSSLASGSYSHAEGSSTTASGQRGHAEGNSTTASGIDSHAEGWNTTASGYASHAEGGGRATASGPYSHAEGNSTEATGEMAHAEGNNSLASGLYSHAQNLDTIASGNYQTALGKYNLSDSNNAYALIIGNGTSSSRSNALTVDWNGNVVAGKTVTLGTNTEAEENGIRVKGGGTRNAWLLRNISAANGDGDAVLLGNGGATIIGGGEAHNNLWNALGVSAGTERLDLASDNAIYLWANCGTIANRVGARFTNNGDFLIEGNGSYWAKSQDIDRDAAAPSETQYGPYYRMRDKDNEDIGYVRTFRNTNGAVGIQLVAVNEVSGSAPTNTLTLRVESDGTQSVGVSNAAQWRSALGIGTSGAFPVTKAQGGTGKTNTDTVYYGAKSLYAPSSPGTGNVTLSETAANYNILLIQYRDNENHYSSKYILGPNGKQVVLDINYASGGYVFIKTRTVSISGTAMNTVSGTTSDMTVPGTSTNTTNHIYITQVWGWK